MCIIYNVMEFLMLASQAGLHGTCVTVPSDLQASVVPALE